MGEINFTLNKILEELEVTPNYVAVRSQIRPNTIYSMKENDLSRINKETLEKLLDTINDIASEKGLHRKFNIQDLINYKYRQKK